MAISSSGRFSFGSALGRLRPEVAEEFGLSGTPAVPSAVRALLIAGPNSSGKSFLLRYFAAIARDANVSPISVSMAQRAGGGFGAMVYGLGDSQFGTGACSVSAVKGALETASRAGEGRCIVLLDEPDIGLSDEYVLDLAARIATSFAAAPAHWRGIAVTSHNALLLSTLATRFAESGVRCAELVMGGTGATTIAEWAARTVAPRPIEDLEQQNIERFRRISRLLDTSSQKPRTSRRSRR